MNYVVYTRSLDGKKYITFLKECHESEKFNPSSEFKVSYELFEVLKNKIKLNVYNDFSTSLYYISGDSLETLDDITYDDSLDKKISLEQLRKSFENDVLVYENTNLFSKLVLLMNELNDYYRVLLSGNLILTSSNKEEIIDKIVEVNDEKVIEAFVAYNEKYETYTKLLEILPKVTEYLETIRTSEDSEKIREAHYEALELLKNA